MKKTANLSRKSSWLLWLAMLALFAAVVLYPAGSLYTRSAGIVLAVMVWTGLMGLCWRRRAVRFALLGITFVLAAFVLAPGKKRRDVAGLRADYVAGLRRYEGVKYFWGGENFAGIDCSGLVRRGLVDALFLRGVRTCDSAAVRRAFWLWWNDCTASGLGKGENQTTSSVLDTQSINALDQSRILPGDLAVTSSGVHVMAYLGSGKWIEAEPEAGRTIIVTPPSDNQWFKARMRIVRWRDLQE